ncbi:hypothetical protein SAMN05216529_11489 [Faecalicatena contorta]|uniref:Uncharacterized protein n=1 Tax=Faecalicatena contorta TaxID=39482 RepID=A0A315ZSI7_9FIRM|nr:hypothetical protein A8805_11489 [Faecalicatena contorta]SUQ15640.1 hypothetical protein SAMN05216529_11489 [Faecalicatena contorta]
MKKNLGKRVHNSLPITEVLRWCSCITACERESRDMRRFINLLTKP